MTELSEGSAWAPFRARVFAVMWAALLIGNIGTWMRDVGSGWLMTTLSHSALTVSLVQVATTLPIFLLSLPAGALADSVDRRRLMIGLSCTGAAILVVLALLAQGGHLTPGLLLVCLLSAGVVTAMMAPVLQSLAPLMVPRTQLREAIALNSMGLNIARAIGPAVGGVLVVVASAAWTFWFDAVTYLILAAAFWWWKGSAQPAAAGSPERIGPALRTGVRFAWNAPGLQRVMVRAALFFAFASAYWALLPLLARRHLGGDAAYYGILLACVGGGAVVGAVLMPRIRRSLSAHALMQAGLLVTVAAMLVVALWPHRVAAAVALGVAGAAWIAVLTTASVATQTQLPNWVRGRGLAVYLTVFYGTMTLGSLIWGFLADVGGIAVALCAAASVGLLAAAASQRLPLPAGEPDLAPSNHWAEPIVGLEGGLPADRGSVMVTVQYRIAPADRDVFIGAMQQLARQRLRDGGYHWGLFEATDQAGAWTEVFYLPDWAEHQRQHRRVTKEDAALQQRIRALHQGDGPPIVVHGIAA